MLMKSNGGPSASAYIFLCNQVQLGKYDVNSVNKHFNNDHKITTKREILCHLFDAILYNIQNKE